MSSLIRPLSLAVTCLAFALSGCGGGDDNGPSAPIAVAFSPAPPSQLSISAVTAVTAAVTNDSSQAGVNWSVTCSGSDCGSFNPANTASGTPSNYTPPVAMPNPATVTITATSAADSSKSVSATVTLTAATTPPLADGTYVFHVSGLDNNGPYNLAGAFTVAGGVIIGGEQDLTDASYGSSDLLVAAQCSIKTAGGNIQLILATANNQVGTNGVEVIRGTLVSASRALLSQFDPAATATGSLDLQTSTATPSGGYAFAVSGTDTNNNGLAMAMGGILNFNGTTLNAAASVFDLNDGGSPLQAQAFTSGSITAPDAYGRVTIDLTPSAASQVGELKFSAYIVGVNRLQLIEDQADVLNANLGGPALGQGANAGKFTLGNVAGASYASGLIGADGNNSSLTLAGGFGLNSNGTVSGQLAFADSTAHQGNTISGTYTVNTTGRVTLSNVALATTGITLGFQLYLDGNGNGLVIGMDTFEVTAGPAFAQVSSPGSGSYALSTLGINGAGTFSAVGPVALSGGSFSGFTDYNNFGQPLPALTFSGTQDTSNGELTLTGLSGDTTTSSVWGYYPIDAGRLIAIEIDGVQLGLLYLEQVTP
jgi:hypothetical protein